MTDAKGLSEEEVFLLRNIIAVLSGTYKTNAAIPSLEAQLIVDALKLLDERTALAERLKVMTEREQSLMNQVRDFHEAVKKAGLVAQYLSGELFILNEPLVKTEERLKACEEAGRSQYREATQAVRDLRQERDQLTADLAAMTESQKRCWNAWTLAEQNVKQLEADLAKARAALVGLIEWCERHNPAPNTLLKQAQAALAETQ